MTNQDVGRWPIVDADAHVTEQADAWTASMPKKYLDICPRVETNPKTGHSHWRVGERWFWPVGGGMMSHAGWHEHLPSAPVTLEEADPACYDSGARLKRMDEHGIDVALLYPNLIGFVASSLIPHGLEFSVATVRAYNEYIWDWSAADRDRLVPMAMVPFWDMDSAIAEMKWAANKGFKGVLLANKYERIGLPSFVDPHWDPLYAVAQDLDLPINYHIGFGDGDEMFDSEQGDYGDEYRDKLSQQDRIDNAKELALILMANDDPLGKILTSGVCERFPRLKFVNVETGLSHVIYYLESLDWHWKIHGNSDVLQMLPSEYFRRQVFHTHWFERLSLPLLQAFPDNFMFSTDYPHGTGLGPGPASGMTEMPRDFVNDAYGPIDPVVRDKALYGNADRVYGLDIKSKFGS